MTANNRRSLIINLKETIKYLEDANEYEREIKATQDELMFNKNDPYLQLKLCRALEDKDTAEAVVRNAILTMADAIK